MFVVRPILVAAIALFLLMGPVGAADQPGQVPQPSYRVLGNDKGKVAIVNAKGEVEWEYPTRFDGHDLWLLPNGNVLLSTGPATTAEVTPQKKVVWQYTVQPKEGYKGKVEVHAFQRLDNGQTMIAESGNGRIVEVDRDGKIVHAVPLAIDRPSPHRDTRMVRKLANGHYLVCHEGDSKVREYDAQGKVVWSIEHDELPGIRLAWVTTLHHLSNGNLIVGNCHAGPDTPQLFEVTRDKKVVWTFKDFKTFGNSLAATHVLDLKGKVIR